MSEVDPFFERVRYYVEPDYEVTDPDAEVTQEQLKAMFDKCVQLHSPVELDASFLEMRESLVDVFGGDEVDETIVYMTSLNSVDTYRIFGTYVDLDTFEAISRPEKKVVLRAHTIIESPFGPILMMSQSRRYELDLNLDTRKLSPNFEEKTRVIDRAKLKAIRQIFSSVLGESVAKPRTETLNEKIRRWSEEYQAFTQARWIEAMLLLDMVAILKELGLTSTDELNWQA